MISRGKLKLELQQEKSPQMPSPELVGYLHFSNKKTKF